MHNTWVYNIHEADEESRFQFGCLLHDLIVCSYKEHSTKNEKKKSRNDRN